jgi:hypothetical protein
MAARRQKVDWIVRLALAHAAGNSRCVVSAGLPGHANAAIVGQVMYQPPFTLMVWPVT